MKQASDRNIGREGVAPPDKSTQARGFTLTEVIAVLAIIAILAAAVIGLGRYATSQARIGKTKATFGKLKLGIGLFKEDFGVYIPDSAKTNNGQSLQKVLAQLKWPRTYTDALGQKRTGRPSPSNYDKPAEILFFFLQEMYDVMNLNGRTRQANKTFLASLPRKEAYVKFKRNELADTDKDELPEVVDGWGMPFLYVAADEDGDSAANIEPHEGRNAESFSLYSFGPDKLGYYRKVNAGEKDYLVGDLDFDKRTDRSDQTEMLQLIRKFARDKGYSVGEAIDMLNKDNITNWERED